jgi:serine/threonine protein kinase/Flp pilus assembly protein TadD
MNTPEPDPTDPAGDEAPATAAGDEELLAALADDFSARLRRRERPTVEEYVAKHPALAERIRKVLAAVAMIEQTRPTDFATANEGLGSTVGRYKLLERIGEGGFGIVYMAEQQHPVRRKVALKVIKPGMDSRQVLARFEAERQALAIMDHPNIARVLDAGATDTGRPYFVMELVKGEPITDYCDRNRLEPRQRLELFVQVCHAVQHAHQKGVIHRDLKPSNVLVATHDTKPVVKVIDFGVAKALGPELTGQTLFTGFAQLLGTPLYMSPEQAGQSSLDVDTRSDIYSLGVLLYELLTGTTPFDKDRFNKAAQDEIRRIIREEEPPRPSTRLSGSKDSLASISAQRQTEPAKLTKLVRGELDWIVMTALEKDRARRYETVNGLGRDIERYLNNETVAACPPSSAYRLRKFARRNKGALLTGLAISAALVMGSLVSTWQAIRATRAEATATALRTKAEAHSKRAREVVDEMYTQVAERWLADRPQMEPVQRAILEKALKYYAEFARESSHDPAVRFETARANRQVADIQWRLGAIDEAVKSYQETVDRLEALRAEFPRAPEYRQNLANALHKFGTLLGDTGERFPRAEQIHRRALAMQEQLAAEFPSVAEYRSDLATGQWHLAEILGPDHASSQRMQESVALYHSSLAICQTLAAEYPAVPLYRQFLANGHLGLYRTLGPSAERESHGRSALEILNNLVVAFPTVPAYRSDLGTLYWSLSNSELVSPEEAERLKRKALGHQEELVSEFPAILDYRYDLARTLADLAIDLTWLQRQHEAESTYRKAAAIAEKLVAEAPNVDYYPNKLVRIYALHARLLAATGRPEEAEALFNKAMTLGSKFIARFPETHLPEEAASARLDFALFLANHDRPDEAQAHFENLLELGATSPKLWNRLARRLTASAPIEWRRPPWAVQLAKKALDLDRDNCSAWDTLGVAQYRAGDYQGAIESVRRSMELNVEPNAEGWFVLAMAHYQLRNREEARRWYERAISWMNENAPTHQDLIRLRAEAEELLGVDLKKPPASAPATLKPQPPPN